MAEPAQAWHVQTDHAIAHELIDEAIGADEGVARGAVEAIDAARELAGSELLGEAGRSSYVGEQHGHLELGAIDPSLPQEEVAA
jgi:hypothetical protein